MTVGAARLSTLAWGGGLRWTSGGRNGSPVMETHSFPGLQGLRAHHPSLGLGKSKINADN